MMDNAKIYPWQQALWQRLCRQIAHQRMPHAVLLAGPAGVGKHSLAQALAARVLCRHPQQDIPCGRCHDCDLLAAGSHPDLLTVLPAEAGKAIRIDQIREVTEFAGKTAQQSGYRVILIEPAEAMNVNAANALLKVLEEPGAHTLFILVSNRTSGVLPTIRSRCQLLQCKAPASEQGLAWLQEQLQDPGQAAFLWQLSGGLPLKALSLQEDRQLEMRQQLLQGLDNLLAGKQGPAELAAQWMNLDILELLDWLMALLADTIKLAATGDVASLRNQDAVPLLQRAAQQAGTIMLYRFADHLQQMREAVMANTNPNKQLLLEDLLIRWTVPQANAAS